MNAILAKGKKLFGKVALATVALGGILAFFGATSASANTVVYVHARPRAVFVGGYYGPRYYYAPRPVYVGPAYRPYRRYYRPYRAYRYWDPAFHCWRYR